MHPENNPTKSITTHPPRAHHKTPIWTQVKSGLRLAALTLAGLCVVFLFIAGMGYAFFQTEHSKLLGWAFLAVSIPVLILEMDRWKKILPAILGYSVLNGFLILLTGHLPGTPEASISRPNMLVTISLIVVATLLSQTFAKRKLRIGDRFALLAFISSFAW